MQANDCYSLGNRSQAARFGNSTSGDTSYGTKYRPKRQLRKLVLYITEKNHLLISYPDFELLCGFYHASPAIQLLIYLLFPVRRCSDGHSRGQHDVHA